MSWLFKDLHGNPLQRNPAREADAFRLRNGLPDPKAGPFRK